MSSCHHWGQQLACTQEALKQARAVEKLVMIMQYKGTCSRLDVDNRGEQNMLRNVGRQKCYVSWCESLARSVLPEAAASRWMAERKQSWLGRWRIYLKHSSGVVEFQLEITAS